ncbi:MAG TPA: TetR/AcrR family transcriptional regulator [Mycobacterium sp.]|nr:TetR/AcrR family transcriptional regulator [Mycobacterium sp.]
MSGQQPDSVGVGILDSAMRVLVDFGFRRATVESVARYAGVSHMTVYRRWSGKAELFRTAVVREVDGIFQAAFATVSPAGPFDDAVVSVFGQIVWELHGHPLMARVLGSEPEFVLPMLTTDSGPSMEMLVASTSGRLAVLAQQAGSELADPDALADIFVRLAHSLLLVPNPSRPLTAHADVEDYARRNLRPFVLSALQAAR